MWSKIRKLPGKKAPKLDSITNSIFKYSGKKAQSTTMVMILKTGKYVKQPFNHRLISMLNTMFKVFEFILLDDLKLATATTIRPEKFGFWAQHSTTNLLVNVINNYTDNLNKRYKTAVVLLNIEKAFDKVWHVGLSFKLIRAGGPSQLTSETNIRTFLSDRLFHVRVENKVPNSRNISTGILQDSSLSFQLFSIFINDIPWHPKTKIALFAEHTLIYVLSPYINQSCATRLQEYIDLLEHWFVEWKISINAQKPKQSCSQRSQPRTLWK